MTIDCSFLYNELCIFHQIYRFSQFKKNDTIPMNVILDKEIFKDLYIIYIGKKKIINQNNKEIDCIHFKVNLIEGTIFKANEYMNVFVSNDENRIPIYVEAFEILVGAIRVYSKSIKGTKVPIKYLN